MGEGYHLVDGLFVLNTIAFASNNNFSTGCAYIVESVNLWHYRLGHVNVDSIKKLKNMHFINMLDANNFSKCLICKK